jgi:hypothetical protein
MSGKISAKGGIVSAAEFHVSRISRTDATSH